MPQAQVLIVEDEVNNQRIVASLLEAIGISSEVVGTAEDAITQLSNQDYRAALIDLELPGMDGIQLLEEIRNHADFDNMTCIVMTAYHSSQVKQQARDAGCDIYFPKPLQRDEFLDEMKALLG